jgi:hypothetical protein
VAIFGARRGSAVAAFFAAWLVASHGSAQEDLGQRIPGSLGLDAGRQAPAGIYAADRVFLYASRAVADTNGNRLPVGFSLSGVADAVGASGAWEIKPIRTYVNASFGAPFATVWGNLSPPPTSISGTGLADLYLAPLGLGWRFRRFEMVTGYGMYIPTSHLQIPADHFTGELSAGGTVFFDARKAWRASALAAYRWNARNKGMDITRGSTVVVQGGAGVTLARVFDVGLAGYGLWQLSDDSGSAIPAALAGARVVQIGMGPEVDLAVPSARCRFTVRYEHDLAVQSTFVGQILVVSVAFMAWKPRER